MKNLAKDSGTAGFSLLELIVVIAIITLLAGILTPLVKSSLDDAKVAKIVAQVDGIKKAAMKYWYDTDLLAIDEDSNHDLVNQADSAAPAARWKGPYLDTPLGKAQNQFGGTYFRLRSTLVGFSGTGGSNGFSNIGGNINVLPADTGGEVEMDGVPIDTAKALDRAIDGSDAGSETPAAGAVEYDGSSTTTTQVVIYLFKK